MAVIAASVTSAAKRSNRVIRKGPSSAIPAQKAPTDPTMRAVEARSASRETTSSTVQPAKAKIISAWKTASYPLCVDESSEGSANGTSASGGYSTVKSR